MTTFDSILAQDIVRDYLELLRFASISADPQYTQGINNCCNWIASHLRASQFHVDIWQTEGNPIIFGQNLQAGPSKPTVLLYGHYDVQPVDPLAEWTTPPFEPRIEQGRVYARGAQDNKGQLIYVLSALRSFSGTLPVNVKICIEGEEEIGSQSLQKLLPQVADKLKANTLLVVDSGIPNMHTPSITLGVRGIVTLSLHVRGSYTDLHSGLFGGIAYNPNHALIELLAKLRGADGRVQVPGFYDAVDELTAEERSVLSLDWDETESRTEFGVDPTGGERSYPPGESGTVRPTLEINGMSGGYSGPGFKTVIPAVAQAKISCRLVPNQDPDTIAKALIEFLRKNTPPGVELQIEDGHGGRAVRSTPNSPVVQALATAFTSAFGKPCQFILMGGSIPISAELAKAAQAQPLFCGLGLPDDNIHAPNEHFDLKRIEMGCQVISEFLKNYGSMEV